MRGRALIQARFPPSWACEGNRKVFSPLRKRPPWEGRSSPPGLTLIPLPWDEPLPFPMLVSSSEWWEMADDLPPWASKKTFVLSVLIQPLWLTGDSGEAPPHGMGEPAAWGTKRGVSSLGSPCCVHWRVPKWSPKHVAGLLLSVIVSARLFRVANRQVDWLLAAPSPTPTHSHYKESPQIHEGTPRQNNSWFDLSPTDTEKSQAFI